MAFTQPQVSTSAVIQWLTGYLAPYRLRVAGAVVALLIAAGAWLLLGQGVRFAVDNGFMSNNAATLNVAVIGVLVICLVASLATYCRFYLMTWLGERVSADIRQHVFSHLLTLAPDFYATTRTGEVISRFTSDTTVLQTVIGMSLSMAIRSVITFVGSLLLMAITSPLLTLCVLLAVPAVLLPIRLLAPKVRHFAKLSQDKVADIGANVDQSLHEIRTVQAYTAETFESQSFSSRVEAAMQTAKRRIHYRSLLIGTIMALSLSAIIVIAWIGARQVFAGTMTMGELSAFLFYAVMAGGSVATISEVIGEVQRGVGASERLIQLLGSHSDISEGQHRLQTSDATPPSLRFHQVHFAYADSPVLFNDLSLSVAPGETVALVGPSGAGKSTLFHLLMRFYQPQSGHITIDDIPIADCTLASLRQKIAIVTQEPVVFATTVLENIRYGSPQASEDEVKAAAKAAFAHEFIDQLPDRYQTELGERGVRLSGGQRQRIAIARAILANRPILLLDEATSALDAASERRVQEALNRLMRGRTTMVIAHRLATVQHADRIIVMKEGAITSTGKHDELLEHDALYREYAELQLLS